MTVIHENNTGGPALSSRLVNGRLLRFGYTTGSCAAAAAGAAAAMLLNRQKCETWFLTTPRGVSMTLDIVNPSYDTESASCAVQKDSGDDPDITHGILVYARVRKIPAGIVIDGGEGVGRVTKPGLDQNVGQAAINSTPRRMIAGECRRVCAESGYSGGLSVTISIPGGEELAKRTFNPRAGIIGGISVLGTSGMVEPMSEKAWADSLKVEMRQLYAAGHRDVLITIGNFSSAFARDTLGLSLSAQIKCSNFIGDAFSAAVELGFNRALLVGHIGKLVKLGIGVMDTHSSRGDGRIETLVACALGAGASLELLRAVNDSVTTDGILALLREAGLLKQTMAVLGSRMEETLARHNGNNMEAGFICFGKIDSDTEGHSPEVMNREGEIVTQSANALSLMEVFK